MSQDDIIRTTDGWLDFIRKELKYTSIIAQEFKTTILGWVTYGMQLQREETKREYEPPHRQEANPPATQTVVISNGTVQISIGQLTDLLAQNTKQLADFIEHTDIDCCADGTGMFHVVDCPGPKIQRMLAEKVRKLGHRVAEAQIHKLKEKK